MASQTCDQCGSSVAADEQFCPSCGSFMDPMTSSTSKPRPRPAGNVISVSSDGPADSSYEEFSLETPPPPAEPADDGTEPPASSSSRGVTCPSCGAVNPSNNRHCQECGARLSQGPLPTAPRPAVQATAGVRAALAISGLLLGVIVIALLFNAFTGDDPVATSTTVASSTTLPAPVEVGPIDVLGQTCEPDGISSFVCANLSDGDPGTEYQVSWPEVLEGDGEIIIRFTFSELMAITEIRWTNIEEATRFRQNYRARGIEIVSQDQLQSIPFELQDVAGIQRFDYAALNTARLDIRIVSAYDAEVIEENVFDELAISEITIIGRPASPTSNTVPSTTTTTTP